MATTFIEEIKTIDPKLSSFSWGATWEPRTKCVTCFIVAFGIVFLKNVFVLTFLLCSMIVIVLSMQFSVRFLSSKLVLLLPFLLLLAVPILISKGFPIEKELYVFAVTLMLKSTSSLLVMMILILTQPVSKLVQALTALKVPSVIVAVLTITINYVQSIHHTVVLFYKSLKSRLFHASFTTSSMKIYSSVMAGILMKSVDQSDKLYRAMAARGFSGTIPTTSLKPIQKMDWIKSVGFLLFISLLMIIDRWGVS
ncbi:energy-coupling factor transporter transmembrane component T family protein [Alkalihalobacterium bogoriense]|uniref:energy-coupling factor transporter transmembrane component T family protein n=1 Tax=Alkalihalobacterium bogoriense TaxID=246272 RepID=UPI00047CA102|nr:energy-coupling factor transporter transmembrane component T [Alkalihalobacterium bogoriense]